MIRPPIPNKTGKATAADTVLTPDATAEFIVSYFAPTGSILDPAAGKNAFYGKYPNKVRYRCEIKDGSDFFKWNTSVDWIITNPPYSIYDLFLQKSFEVAKNVVFFAPITKAFKSNNVEKMVVKYGGLKEIIFMGGGRKHGFAFGFPVGCLYYKKDYIGNCKITHVF